MSPATPLNRALLKRAERRLERLQIFLHLKPNHGCRASTRAVAVSRPTLWRWEKAYQREGLAGLVPKFGGRGKRSRFSGMKLPPAAIATLQRLIFEFGKRRAWTGSSKAVLCPPLISRLDPKSIPGPILRLVELRPLQVRCGVSADWRQLSSKSKGVKQ